MAIKVPRYGDQIQEQPRARARFDEDAPRQAFGGQVGRSIEHAANVVNDVQQIERERADQAALIEADTAFDSWETSALMDPENGALSKRGKAAFDLPNQVLPQYDAETKRLEGTIGSQRAKLAFKAQAARRRSQISSTLNRHEFAQRNEFYDEQDEAKLASSAEMAANYYNDPERIASELGKQDAVVDSLGSRKGWSTEQISEAKRKNHAGVHADVVARYLARGEYRRGRVYFDEVKDQIGADAVTRLEAAFTAERERVKTEVKQSMNDQLRDISAAAASGLPVAIPQESTLKSIYGEHEGGQRYKIAKSQQELSPKVAQMKQMSASDLTAFVSSARPKEQTGAADQAQVANFLEQRADEILRERNKDPAGYLVTNAPGTQRAWQEFTQAAPEERDAAAATYLRTLRADRERLQISGNDVLPDAYADQVADRLNNPKSAEQLATDIEREAQRWGAGWASVYEQLAPKLSDTAAVIGSGIPRAAAVDLASVANLKDAELKSLLPPGEKWSDLENNVDSRLQDFQRSLPPTASRENSAFNESVKRLAARYMNQGASRGTAVGRAYAALVESQAQLVDFRGTPMRIPATMDGDIAEDGARQAIASYTAHSSDLIVPANAAVLPEQYAEDFTEHVREHGYWMTNPSGTGLKLYVDGGPVPRGRDGVNVTWSQLRDMYAAEEMRRAEETRREVQKRQLAR